MVVELRDLDFIFAGYYAGVSFSLMAIMAITFIIKKRVMKDIPGLLVLGFCMVAAFMFTIAFYVIAKKEILITCNHAIYHTGVILFLWLSYSDRDYQYHASRTFSGSLKLHRLAILIVMGFNLAFLTLWFTRCLCDIPYISPMGIIQLCLHLLIYITYCCIYTFYTWVLSKLKYLTNPYHQNSCMSYLTLIYFNVMLLGIIAFVLSTTITNDINTNIFPGLFYVVADTIFFLAIAFFLTTHTHADSDQHRALMAPNQGNQNLNEVPL